MGRVCLTFSGRYRNLRVTPECSLEQWQGRHLQVTLPALPPCGPPSRALSSPQLCRFSSPVRLASLLPLPGRIGISDVHPIARGKTEETSGSGRKLQTPAASDQRHLEGIHTSQEPSARRGTIQNLSVILRRIQNPQCPISAAISCMRASILSRD